MSKTASGPIDLVLVAREELEARVEGTLVERRGPMAPPRPARSDVHRSGGGVSLRSPRRHRSRGGSQGEGGTRIGRSIRDGRADSLEVGFWGDEPIASDGSVVVLTGLLDEQRFRLWFVSRKRLGSGISVTLDRENDAAQLVVGSPPVFVSNRVDLTFVVSKNGRSARVRGSAREPELRGGPSALRFHGEVPLNTKALETSLELEPYKEYQPDILPKAARPSKESAPEGFTVKRSPNPTFLLAGSLALGGSYLLPVLSAAGRAFQQDTGLLLVPFVGPGLYAKERDTLDAWSLGFAATLGQVGGLAIIGIGLALPRRRWVRDTVLGPDGTLETSSLRVVPWMTPATHGIQLLGTF